MISLFVFTSLATRSNISRSAQLGLPLRVLTGYLLGFEQAALGESMPVGGLFHSTC